MVVRVYASNPERLTTMGHCVYLSPTHLIQNLEKWETGTSQFKTKNEYAGEETRRSPTPPGRDLFLSKGSLTQLLESPAHIQLTQLHLQQARLEERRA